MPNSLPDTKADLRRRIIDRIRGTPADRRSVEQEGLSERFSGLPGLAEAKTVLLYLSAFDEEVSTWAFCSWALSRGKRLLLPRVARTPKRLRLMEVADLDRDLTVGTLGISEPRLDRPEFPPEMVDWALIPGVAFDAEGYRLGRGGGYYDRLLPHLRPDAPCWAIAFDCQLVEIMPREPHDMPLNGVATASRLVVGVRGGTNPMGRVGEG